jgi:hypothetical protein
MCSDQVTVRVIIQISKRFASLISIYFLGDFPDPQNKAEIAQFGLAQAEIGLPQLDRK